MKTVIAILVLALALAASGAAAQCLDYDTVMPLMAELPDVGDIIDVESRGPWVYALEAFSNNGRWLQIFDVSDPTAPQLATQIGLPGHSNQLLARDGRLYILARPADTTSLYIYTNEPPAFPTLLGSLIIDDDVHDLDVEGTTVALAAANGGLLLIDAADPTAMALVGTFAPPAAQGESRTVCLRDGHALLGLGTYFPDQGHVHWLDVSDPTMPTPLGDAPTGRQVFEALLLPDQPLAMITAEQATALVDLSDPGAPGIGSWRTAAGEHLVVSGDRALQINPATGASMLVDISDPHDLRWLAPRPRTILDAAPVGGGLALARGDDGLAIAQLTGPEAAPIVAVAHDGPGTNTLVPTDRPGLVLGLRRTDTADDVQVIDVSDPTAPRIRSTISLSTPRAAATQGHLALIARLSTGHLYDLSDPDLPQSLATWTPPIGTIGMQWHGNLLFVAANSGGLVIMDAGDPTQPAELSRFDPATSVRSVLVYDDTTLLLACSSGGLKVLDVTDPTSPALISELDLGSYADNLVVTGTRCFVGGFFDSDLVEVDLSDLAAPSIAAVTPQAGGASSMAVHQGQLWLAGSSTINVLDLGPPGQVHPAGELNFFTAVGGLLPAGDFMLTSCGNALTLRPPCSTITMADEPVRPVAARLQVAPNPANPRTEIAFDMATAGRVRLEVYDLAGRRVSTVFVGRLEAGSHRLAWDGRDAAGRDLASGTYLARLESGHGLRTGKVSLVR